MRDRLSDPTAAAVPVVRPVAQPERPAGVSRRVGGSRLELRARARLFVPSRAWGNRGRREILFAAGAIAVLFHVLLTLAIVEAPHLWPSAPMPPSAKSGDQDPPTMELVMDKNKYAGGATMTPPASASPPAPKTPPAPSKQGSPDGFNLPPAASPSADTVPPPLQKKESLQAPTPSTLPPQATPPEPQVNIDPTDNGFGYGMQDENNPRIIPASPDNTRANKMPAYPRAAGRRGEEGSVEMMVSIAADGAVTSVEVAVSSGYPELDRTAQQAVSRWHFRPAIHDGVGVPTQMMQVFNFKIDR